jgi:hypothetical protein
MKKDEFMFIVSTKVFETAVIIHLALITHYLLQILQLLRSMQ